MKWFVVIALLLATGVVAQDCYSDCLNSGNSEKYCADICSSEKGGYQTYDAYTETSNYQMPTEYVPPSRPTRRPVIDTIRLPNIPLGTVPGIPSVTAIDCRGQCEGAYQNCLMGCGQGCGIPDSSATQLDPEKVFDCYRRCERVSSNCVQDLIRELRRADASAEQIFDLLGQRSQRCRDAGEGCYKDCLVDLAVTPSMEGGPALGTVPGISSVPISGGATAGFWSRMRSWMR